MPPKNKTNVKFDPIQQGIVKRHPDGFGFFIPDNSYVPDVYIPKKHMTSIMTNDRVEAVVVPEPGGERFRGSIKKLLKRSTTSVVGQIYQINHESSILKDESLAWGEDLIITATSKSVINNGDWVEVEVLTYPGDKAGFTGRVKSHIGDPLDPLTDNKRSLILYNIPVEFSDKALKQTHALPIEVTKEDKLGRVDLTDKRFITIDGATAKDFDDAILVEKTNKGFLLKVAIADVSHYVKPGSAIDDEAVKRGTSTYFPGFVAPMLPEALSNELCSLKPQVERLTFVAEIHVDFNGAFLSYKFFEAVIKSHSRVTYGEAQEIIEGNASEKHAHVSDIILLAKDLAKVLMNKRFNDGSLELNVPETIVELDETGDPVDIIKSERLFAHRLIEELMLMANVAVAKAFTENKIDALYRIHESPNELAIEVLKIYLSKLGVFMPVGGSLQKSLTKALQQFEGLPQSAILNILTLRSMSQAKYSPDNIGHFGLGFSDYTHFTSPIRRYPDLIVHRLLKSMFYKDKGYMPMSHEDLSTSGIMLSACEQRSVKAERFINAVKKARFMNKHIGEEFTGIISSVAKFGVFVQLRQFNVDGLVKTENLAGEALMYDEENLRLVGRRSGLSYNIGEELKVSITHCNIDQGQIDFSLGEGELQRVKGKANKADIPKEKPRKKKSNSSKSSKSSRRKKSRSKKSKSTQAKSK